MMRLLMLNNEFPPLGGGTGTVNYALLQRFANVTDLDIDLITATAAAGPEEEQFAERIRIFKVPVDRQDIHHASNRELVEFAARALLLGLRRHHASPYSFGFAWSTVPAGAVALALRGLVGLRYLVRVCGPDIPGFEQRYGWLYPVLSPVIRATWRGAETVVAKCQGEADMIRAIDPNVKVTIVPNGVDPTVFRPGDPVPDAGPLRLLCVARLIQRKGQHQLIQAVKRLTDEGIAVTLDLVGTGDALHTYQAQVQALGLEDRVRFVGYVPRAEIAARYAAAHVFVLPSYNEGMSVATLEAMAAGLPVVVTRTGGTAELVAEEINGLTFDWADVHALTAHLRRLATDRALARRMGAASRARAERFSWNRAVGSYLAIFREVVAGQPMAARQPHLV